VIYPKDPVRYPNAYSNYRIPGSFSSLARSHPDSSVDHVVKEHLKGLAVVHPDMLRACFESTYVGEVDAPEI